MTGKSSIHVQDCIRKTRDAVPLNADEIAMLVGGAANGSIPDYPRQIFQAKRDRIAHRSYAFPASEFATQMS